MTSLVNPLRLRALLGIAAAGCGLAVSGCGSSTTSPADAVRNTIRTYLQAATSGNGQLACAQITAASRKLAVQNAAHATKATTCASALHIASTKLPAKARNEIANADISDIKVTGKKATAVIEGSSHYTLLNVGGRWQLTSSVSGSSSGGSGSGASTSTTSTGTAAGSGTTPTS